MKPTAYGLESGGALGLDAGLLLGARVEATTPHAIPVDWTPQPPGATAVDVSDAVMSISPRSQDESVPAVSVSPDAGGTFVLSLPSGTRVRSLTLSDLGIGVGDSFVTLTSQGDLDAHDPPLRLTVALPDPRGGFAAPTFAVPAVAGRAGVTPNTLTGASFEGGVLSLPDVLASKLRIALVTGDPGDFSAAPDVSLSKVSALTARYPTALTLSDESDTGLWSHAKELPPGSPAQLVDFKAGLKKALLDKVNAGATLAVALKLTTSSPAVVSILGPRIRGALVRSFPGTVRTSIEGAPTALSLVKPGDPALLVDGTTTISADITVRYEGIRLVRELSDDVPRAATSGIVVGADGARVELPPQAGALKTHALARVGLIGRAPEACELSVRLVQPLSGEPLPGDPAVVRLDPANTIGVVWLIQKSPALASGPIAVSARATRGRFFWATDPRGKPLVQIAVVDPDPPERTVSLGGRVILSDLTPASRPSVALAPSFESSPAPVFETPMFVTVDLSDVTVRYAR